MQSRARTSVTSARMILASSSPRSGRFGINSCLAGIVSPFVFVPDICDRQHEYTCDKSSRIFHALPAYDKDWGLNRGVPEDSAFLASETARCGCSLYQYLPDAEQA